MSVTPSPDAERLHQTVPFQLHAHEQPSPEDSSFSSHTEEVIKYSSRIADRIRGALIPNSEEKTHFLPVINISEIITEDSIRDELERFPSKETLKNAANWAAFIVTPNDRSETGMKKIFALLNMIERADLIEGFIESEGRLCDSDLPFEMKQLNGQSRGYEFLFGKLKYFEMEALFTKQQLFLVPVFGRGIVQVHKYAILPFYEDKNASSNFGHAGTVKKVKLHAAHYNDGTKSVSSISKTSTASGNEEDIMLPCAIKTLHANDFQTRPSSYPASCEKEISNLMRVRDIDQDYLIELLFAYIHDSKYHLVFPWANGNLRSLWRDQYPDPNTPQRNDSLARWVFEQSHRLLQGLKIIHGYGVRRGSNGTRNAGHGTHGDLKPENILWFGEPGNHLDLGKLKISDLGGAQFHTSFSKSLVHLRELHITDTYQAPEAYWVDTVGQSYDTWSLGCVLLEFMTWYFQGWKGVDDFSKSRGVDNDPFSDGTVHGDFVLSRHDRLKRDGHHANSIQKHWLKDRFFHHQPHETSGCGFLAKSKLSVKIQFNQLYQHPMSSQFSTDYLKIIEECLLRVNKEKRVPINDILQRFEKMRDDSKTDVDYWTGCPRKVVHPRTGLSELCSFADLDTGAADDGHVCEARHAVNTRSHFRPLLETILTNDGAVSGLPAKGNHLSPSDGQDIRASQGSFQTGTETLVSPLDRRTMETPGKGGSEEKALESHKRVRVRDCTHQLKSRVQAWIKWGFSK
ncbi:uncharacterized protein PG998_000182 [Apiospora kogelbergensis]|uniref:uncharacterized protein n=1 Tax=Apiospora kogelbergensis TaxID=1337665 RepID=UPI003130ACA8